MKEAYRSMTVMGSVPPAHHGNSLYGENIARCSSFFLLLYVCIAARRVVNANLENMN